MWRARRFEKVGDQKYQSLNLKYPQLCPAWYFRDFSK